MTTESNREYQDATAFRSPNELPHPIKHPSEAHASSLNENPVSLVFDDLAPHVKIIKPSRPSLTYDRME